ncbi:hypothetical protein V6N13_029699 [Hibiscus sabdariffa]
MIITPGPGKLVLRIKKKKRDNPFSTKKDGLFSPKGLDGSLGPELEAALMKGLHFMSLWALLSQTKIYKNSFTFTSSFDKAQNWATLCSSRRNKSVKSKRREKPSVLKGEDMGDDREIATVNVIHNNKDGGVWVSQEGEEFSEARASLEVCENLGLIFNAEEEVILEKFKELE